MNNLITISGKIKSGKDEVGNMFRFFHNYQNIINDGYTTEQTTYQEYLDWCNVSDVDYDDDYKIIKFADKLKDCICLILGCTREQLEDRDFKNTPLGEQWRRWKVESQYCDNPLDGEDAQYYDNLDYFETEQAAKDFITKEESQYGVDNWSGDIESEILTPRRILQLLGTQGGRMAVHPNIWVNATFAEYYHNEEISYPQFGGHIDKTRPEIKITKPNWLITDNRFPNEANAIRDRGGLLIRVNRPMKQRFPDEWKTFIENKGLMKSKISNENQFLLYWRDKDYKFYEKLTHESDTGLDEWTEWNYVIENDGTIEDLLMKVSEIVKSSECEKCKKQLNL